MLLEDKKRWWRQRVIFRLWHLCFVLTFLLSYFWLETGRHPSFKKTHLVISKDSVLGTMPSLEYYFGIMTILIILIVNRVSWLVVVRGSILTSCSVLVSTSQKFSNSRLHQRLHRHEAAKVTRIQLIFKQNCSTHLLGFHTELSAEVTGAFYVQLLWNVILLTCCPV